MLSSNPWFHVIIMIYECMDIEETIIKCISLTEYAFLCELSP